VIGLRGMAGTPWAGCRSARDGVVARATRRFARCRPRATAAADPARCTGDPHQPHREHEAFGRIAAGSRGEVPHTVAPGPPAGADLDEKHACASRPGGAARGDLKGMSGACLGLDRGACFGPVRRSGEDFDEEPQVRESAWSELSPANRIRRALPAAASAPCTSLRRPRSPARSMRGALRCAARHRRSRARCRRGTGAPAPPRTGRSRQAD
jgi:hypothetical protein